MPSHRWNAVFRGGGNTHHMITVEMKRFDIHRIFDILLATSDVRYTRDAGIYPTLITRSTLTEKTNA